MTNKTMAQLEDELQLLRVRIEQLELPESALVSVLMAQLEVVEELCRNEANKRLRRLLARKQRAEK